MSTNAPSPSQAIADPRDANSGGIRSERDPLRRRVKRPHAAPLFELSPPDSAWNRWKKWNEAKGWEWIQRMRYTGKYNGIQKKEKPK